MPLDDKALDICAQEPIRIPGGIQPHGALLVLDRQTLKPIQRSANAAELLGADIFDVTKLAAGDAAVEQLLAELEGWQSTPEHAFERAVQLGARRFFVSAQATDQGLIVEFEPADSAPVEAPLARLRRFADVMDQQETVVRLSDATAREMRDLTGFDRVMIYRFDEDWNGTVIAESGNGRLPSYLDLRFPATDIPAQARELYRINRIRLIPTADYVPVPIEPPLSPVDGKPLDLGSSALRSVSPVHLEYMRNMQTQASMSVSLIVDGRLWGLISCHHSSARILSPPVRASCEFLGRVVSQQIASHERAAEANQRLGFKRIETELVAHLGRAASFQQGLVERPAQWLGLTNAEGAAVVTEGMTLTTGQVPDMAAITALAKWLHGSKKADPVFATDSLADHWKPGKEIADIASGIIATPISSIHPSFIIWFRPEVVRTVCWGGEPTKLTSVPGDPRLHPRTSFETWKESVRGRSNPWTGAEIHSARDFRHVVVEFVLRQAEERAVLTAELQRTNKELESFSYSISHDLRAPFRHISGYAQLLGEEEPELREISRHYLQGISSAARSAGQLVDDLLRFSQLGRASLRMSPIDMQKVANEIQRSFESETAERNIEWRIGKLPLAYGDHGLVRQVVYNFADNAVKYTRDTAQPIIEIGGSETDEETRYFVTDNGIGFDMAYAGKLFQVFQRLHHVEDFEGTGIGLALSKRIIERHGGAIAAEGRLGSGATFSFTLPKPKKGRGS